MPTRVATHGQEESADGQGEVAEVQILGVEDGDDSYGPDVVGDRQREQEQPRPARDPGSEEGQHTNREGDVGRHGDTPAPDRRLTGIEIDPYVDESREDHAAEGGHDGEGSCLGVAQVTVDHLTLDLEPDDEEEDRHQAVVDHVLDVLVEMNRPEVDDQRGLEDLEIGGRPAGVGPDHCDDRSGQKDQAGCRLDPGETDEGTDESLRDEPIGCGPGFVPAIHQPIDLPAERSCSAASTTRAAMPTSAFFM